ncbi:nucleotidyltransferase domain-containing protein [Paradesulfitobacterium ferrireducens]|uniref:nucleotidyltransferase domain-containing protein n=1 Tax=Paradesulfitobacterium ferrireducens TaxID=2816476 RepID=UPI001A9040CA|nr:nucleotidyltransferase domain-containing protein [Paradesulfitobacterium ferrireducens]
MVNFDTREQVNSIVMKYASSLKEHINLHSIYLYGSYANGNYNKDSDIDIAVVADGFTGDIVEDTFMLMKIRRKIDKRIEPHPFSIHEFTEDNPIVKEIINTGVKVI